MENHPIHMPLIYIPYAIMIICAFPIAILLGDCLCWWIQKSTSKRLTEKILNISRVFLYPLTAIFIFYGANVNESINYPEAWASYILVPVDYAASIPLLCIEGIGALYNLLVQLFTWILREK